VQVTPQNAVILDDVAFVSGITFVAVGPGGQILKSTDGGGSFFTAGTADDAGIPGTPDPYGVTVASNSIA
jgi:photosystem II stability/assembly factor-like uncharacterized protein